MQYRLFFLGETGSAFFHWSTRVELCIPAASRAVIDRLPPRCVSDVVLLPFAVTSIYYRRVLVLYNMVRNLAYMAYPSLLYFLVVAIFILPTDNVSYMFQSVIK